MVRSFLVKSMLVAFATVAMSIAISDSAQAQSFGYGGHGVYHGGYNRGVSLYIGSGGYGFNYGSYPNYNYRVYRPYYNVGPGWYGTSHYYYHCPQAVRHGNHYHVKPGHHNWHRAGHGHW